MFEQFFFLKGEIGVIITALLFIKIYNAEWWSLQVTDLALVILAMNIWCK